MEFEELQQLMRARGNVYNLLRCFFLQEPSEEFFKALQEEDFLKDLRGYHPELDEGVDLVSGVVSSPRVSESMPELAEEFIRLFVGPSPIPLYESTYRSKTGLLMQEETAAVRRKYLEAGLAVDPRQGLPEDHIGAELEFVFFLCQTTAETEDGRLREALLRMQQDFFREHLTAWVSSLCDRLLEETTSPYFQGLARMTRGFVTWDYQEIVSHFLD